MFTQCLVESQESGGHERRNGETPPPPIFLSLPFRSVSHDFSRLTASPKSESWNRWNMNGSVVCEKGVWAKERRWGNCNCNLSVAKSLCLPVL